MKNQKKMSESEVVAAVASIRKISKAKATEFFRDLTDATTSFLRQGKNVSIPDFGTLAHKKEGKHPKPPVSQSVFIGKIASDLSVSKSEVRLLLRAFSDVLIGALKEGKSVALPGFGTFSILGRRPGRRPNGRPAKIVSKNKFDSEQDKAERRAGAKSLQELLESISKASPTPKKVSVSSREYRRNSDIAVYVKRTANGLCELCGYSVPFSDRYGNPYLELHHIKWLAAGGKDTLENSVALCPNCHRKMHIARLQSDVEALVQKARGHNPQNAQI
jgi:nucleoid DNA-binding protein/5-methylcytosine-specific restriction endonuclease McrA